MPFRSWPPSIAENTDRPALYGRVHCVRDEAKDAMSLLPQLYSRIGRQQLLINPLILIIFKWPAEQIAGTYSVNT